MRTKLILNLVLVTLALAACGGSPAQSVPESVAPTQAEAQPIAIPTLTVAAPAAEVLPTAAQPATEAPVAEGGVSFANDVKPIISGSCADCHGGNQTKAGLDVTTYESLMAGSFNGTVIVAGNSAESLLIQLVSEGEMPKRGDKLTPEQVQIISDWVAGGALNN